jgi:hypothetical protein
MILYTYVCLINQLIYKKLKLVNLFITKDNSLMPKTLLNNLE